MIFASALRHTWHPAACVILAAVLMLLPGRIFAHAIERRRQYKLMPRSEESAQFWRFTGDPGANVIAWPQELLQHWKQRRIRAVREHDKRRLGPESGNPDQPEEQMQHSF
jgi:hypothetical protein